MHYAWISTAKRRSYLRPRAAGLRHDDLEIEDLKTVNFQRLSDIFLLVSLGVGVR